jgi:hypothetical protein
MELSLAPLWSASRASLPERNKDQSSGTTFDMTRLLLASVPRSREFSLTLEM